MKNFKKVLALVLAVACLLSFAAVAGATNVIKTSEVYDDAASINADYTEALDVLTAIGVLDGKGANSFKPQDTLKRSEAAKIIAVFANTDPEINSLYSSANPFTDVAANHWAVSYIAYCYKTGIIAGVKDGVFAPDARLTGIQFLKMVLCTIGFDAHEEGLVGNSWKVNTLQLAKNVGLTDVLGNAYNYDAELTREAAAQIMLNALNANTVSYGNAIQTAATTRTYATVAGAVANSEFMYQKWGLRKINATQDDFGRPAHKWLLKNVDFGKTYTDTPLASYTVKVAGCTILSDCLFDTTNPVGTKSLRKFENSGTPSGTEIIADTTELRYGAQGRLTEVYEDRIVYIDTFLGKVLNVIPGRTDAQGHTYRAASVYAEIYLPTVGGGYTTVNASFETEGFVKDQFVRVTGITGAAAGVARTIEIKTMEAAETKQGIFNGYSGTLKELTQVKLGEEYLSVAEKGFGFNIKGDNINKWMGIELVAFMDKYGNVLGLDKYWAALNYGVVDALWIGLENGQATLKADLVTMSGEVLSAVTVASITKDGNVDTVDEFVKGTNHLGIAQNVQVYAEAFGDYYDKLAYFTTNMNGQYELQLATGGQFDQETSDYYGALRNLDFTKEPTKTIEFTTGYQWGYEATIDNAGKTTKTGKIPMDANTVILVHNAGTKVPFASRVQGGYSSYTGYASVPSLTANVASYHINKQTGFADVVYVCDTSATGSRLTVFAAGDAIQVTGISYDALNQKYFNYNVTVYVVDEATGALTKTTYTMKEQATLSYPNYTTAPAKGFHTAYVNADNEITFGINNANYATANANYGGENAVWTVQNREVEGENGPLGPNAYAINNNNYDSSNPNSIKNDVIYSTNATTNGYAFDETNKVSEIAVVNSVQYDVLAGDQVYVYQNYNNPQNPIYCVVDKFNNARVSVVVNDTTYVAGEDDLFDTYISSYNFGFANRTWEAAYVVAAPGYSIDSITNNGSACTKRAGYDYWYDTNPNAKVGNVVIYLSTSIGSNGNSFDANRFVGPISLAGNTITVNGNYNVSDLLGYLKGDGIDKTTSKLDDYSKDATIVVKKNIISYAPVDALDSDPITSDMAVYVYAANGNGVPNIYYISTPYK